MGEPGPEDLGEEEKPAEPEEKQEEQKPSEETVVVVKESPAPVASPKAAATRYTAPPRPKASPRPDATTDPKCTHEGGICFHFDKDYHWVEYSKCGKRFDVYQAHSFKYADIHTVVFMKPFRQFSQVLREG